jgi:hypothetical protein
MGLFLSEKKKDKGQKKGKKKLEMQIIPIGCMF